MINGLLILLISLFCDEYEGGVYGLLAVRFLLSYPCVTHYVSVLCHLCLCLPHLLCVIVYVSSVMSVFGLPPRLISF